MTRLSLCGTLLVVLTVPARSARADGLECAEPVFRAGDVRSGVPLAHRFAFVNRGPDAVEITDVRPSCGCLTPRLGQRRYGPGEGGTLLLEVNTLTQPPGPHTWRAVVHYRSGGQDHELELLLCAKVITEVQVQPASLSMSTDTALGHEVTVTDLRDQPLAVRGAQTSSPHVRAHLGQPHRDGAGHWASTIRLEVLPDCPEGRHDEVLLIVTSDPAYPELKVPLTVVKRSPQRVSATPATVEISGTPGQPLPSRIVLLGCAGDEEVAVERVEADDPAVRCQWAKGPGPRATLKIQVDHTRLSGGTLHGAVRVHIVKPAPQTVTVPVACALR
jgi:hypothetical protein